MTNPDVDVPVPFTWAALPKAGTVYLLSTGYAIRKRLALSPAGRLATAGLALVVVCCAIYSATQRGAAAAAAFGADLLALVVALVALATYGILAVRHVQRHCQLLTNTAHDIVIAFTATAAGTVHAAELATWPVGRDRTGPFLDAVFDRIDRDRLTVTGTATNNDLFKKMYRPRGFVITQPGRRPKIRREPVDVAGDGASRS